MSTGYEYMFDRSFQAHETAVPTWFLDELEHFAERRVFGSCFRQACSNVSQSTFILESFDDPFQVIFVRDGSEFPDEFYESVNLALFGLYTTDRLDYTVYTGDVSFPDIL